MDQFEFNRRNREYIKGVENILKVNGDFEIDKYYNKLYISYSINRYLKRIK